MLSGERTHLVAVGLHFRQGNEALQPRFLPASDIPEPLAAKQRHDVVECVTFLAAGRLVSYKNVRAVAGAR